MENYENKSKLLREALNHYMADEGYLDYMIEKTRSQIEYHMDQIKLEHKKLKALKNHRNDVEKRKRYRPAGYEQSVRTLITIPDVTETDIKFQANKLCVSIDELKRWLHIDGHYKKIFSS